MGRQSFAESIGVLAAAATCAVLPYALSVLAAGCSSSSSGSADSGSATSADQACADSAHATCVKMQTCTPANLTVTYGSEATCESRIKASCLDILGAPSTSATPDKTEACAQAYASYACADYRNKANVPAPCLPAAGSVMMGGACEYAAQCQSTFCSIGPGSACGVCAAPPMQGASCTQLTSCGPTLTCTSDTLVCSTPAAQGQACGAGQPCGAGLSCTAAGDAGTGGTCQTAAAQPGATCDGAAKTAPNCDGPLALYCDGKTKQCAQTTYTSSGQACGYDSTNGTLVECTAGTCVGADAAHGQLGTCVGRADDNGNCAVPDGGASTPSAGCLPAARCVANAGSNGACRAPAAASCH